MMCSTNIWANLHKEKSNEPFTLYSIMQGGKVTEQTGLSIDTIRFCQKIRLHAMFTFWKMLA